MAIPTAAGVQTLKEIFGRFDPYLAECRSAIRRDLFDAPLGRELSEYFERGKMFRPLLVFASTSAVGGDPATAVPSAQALELLHGASLVHDDIIDNAKERRGRSSLHLRIGTGPAVVLGDYLILRSYNFFVKTKSPRVLEALQVLTHCAEECCRGQIEELTWMHRGTEVPSEEAYFSIIRGKTASQFIAAATVGGILGNGQSEEIEALHEFALNLGIAFQIRDDELDLMTEHAYTANADGDFSNFNVPSLPIIYLTQYNSGSLLQRYRQLQDENSSHSELMQLLEEASVLKRLREVKEHHLQQALRALSCFQKSGDASTMAGIAHQAVFRDA